MPIAEVTEPANVSEQHLIIPHLKYIKETFNLPIEAVIGDAAFDALYILEFMLKELKTKPVIPKNPRGTPKSPDIKFSNKNIPICVAGFEMVSRGKSYDKEQNRIRHKFICPIKAHKKFASNLGCFCPWNHPKFYSNKLGCTTYIRVDIDTSIRNNIDYESQTFKELYKLRSSTERIFSRLLTLCMQRPTITGLNAIRNKCTISHITVLAVALSCVKIGKKDKIRFIKSFLPKF